MCVDVCAWVYVCVCVYVCASPTIHCFRYLTSWAEKRLRLQKEKKNKRVAVKIERHCLACLVVSYLK